MELPGVGARFRLHKQAALAAALLTALLVAAAPAARAATTTTDPNTPVLVTSKTTPPVGFRLTATEVERIAARSPVIIAELRRHPTAIPYEYTKGPGRWQVSWFGAGKDEKELAQVYVDDASGRVTEAWTGFQVAWTMARGYPGAFGRQVNALYVWIPMCVLFVAPFLPWRLPWQRRSRRKGSWSLLHLDLLVLLGFSISLAFFNHAKIGLSVPLAYPFLLYLLVRMLLLAFGRGRPRRPLHLFVPASWLAVAIVFLVGFRVGLNVTNSNVIDVGYAGVIGADKLIHGKPLYGNWPQDNANGDTYGPVNYYAYVPFRAIFGWSGTWDNLPAAHGAAIAFDLLTLLGLAFLGRRIRGPTLGIVLAYAWAAYPFTIYALSSNSNDSLVALLIVLALLFITWAPARGIATALAGFTKFAPLALAPLFLRGVGEWPRKGPSRDKGAVEAGEERAWQGRRGAGVAALRQAPRTQPGEAHSDDSTSSYPSTGPTRSVIAFSVAFAATAVVVMLPVLLAGDLRPFWHDSIAYQAGRGSPFSVWGLWGGLGFEQHLVQGAAVALAIAVAFVPRRRDVVVVSALGAAVLIALQLGITHWFYLYIPWFFPMVAVALFAFHPDRLLTALEEAVRARDGMSGGPDAAGDDFAAASGLRPARHPASLTWAAPGSSG